MLGHAWILKNIDPKKHGRKRNWTLENKNSGKYGVIWLGLKNMSDFRELCFINKDHAQCHLFFKSSQISKLDFLG